MNKRVKNDNYPQLEGINCTKRISGGSSYSRYEAYTDDGIGGELLWLNGPSERDLDWIQFCATTQGHVQPTALGHHLGPPAWILFKEQDGEPLETFLKNLDTDGRVDLYLSVAVQVCGILHAFHLAGHVHGKFNPQVIRLTRHEDDYLHAGLIGWQPPSENKAITATDEFTALKGWLTAMLEQFRVDTTANGNVEDTNIQDVAPRVVVAALEALNGPQSSTLADMLSALATVLTDSLSHKMALVEGDCQENRVFIEKVLDQRARLQELETRQR